MLHFLKSRGFKGAAFSFIISLMFLIIHLTGWYNQADNYFMDSIYQRETDTLDIKIIGIDDKTLNELGNVDSSYRLHYANLISKLNCDDHLPSVIGLDILFTGKSDNEDLDNALVMACKSSSNVITGMNLIFNDPYKIDFKDKIDVSLPYEDLSCVVELGYVNTILDKSDGYVRKVIPKIDNYDSFSYAIYKRYCKSLNLKCNSFKENSYYRFKYSSKPNTRYTVVSLCDVLKDKIPLDDFKDSIVLVGAYTTGLSDDFLTPIKRGEKMNGVEIHANIIDAYRKNDLISDMNYVLNTILSVLIVFIASFILFTSRIIPSSIITLSISLLVFFLEYIALILKCYWPLNLVILFIIISYIANIAYNYLMERKLKLETINAFKKYVAPQVVEKALANGHFSFNLGGESREVACLFVDIRGFTSMSEAMEPIEVVSILNSYLSLVTKAIFNNGGTLDKFIGDAAMALFNAPFALDDYIFKAVKCAIEIRNCSNELDKLCMERFNRSVGFGIGINSGPCVVGNIGCDIRMDYTAIGDTINTASRLEGSAKRGEIVVSEGIYNELKDRVDFKYIGKLSLKGKKEGFDAYLVEKIKEE